jgi:DNA-binding beta-propeller fold protein YncE
MRPVRASRRRAAGFAALVAVFALCLGAGPASARPPLIRVFGRLGTGAGRLEHPIGVAEDGNWIYVVDAGNSRVDEFRAGGRFVRAWGWGVGDGTPVFQICTTSCRAGIAGSGAGQFDHPWGVAVDGAGHVYVTDSGNDRVEEFSPTGSYLSQLGATGAAAGQLEHPLGVAAMSDGGIFVVDSGNDRVAKFSRLHTFVRAWGFGVVDGAHRLEVCTTTCRAGLAGSGRGEFRSPNSIAVNPVRWVFVLDSGNNRVEAFREGGTFIRRWGSRVLENPVGIAVDWLGRICVGDTGHNRLDLFDTSGRLVVKWGAAVLRRPSGVATQLFNRTVVTDTGHDRVATYAQVARRPKPR